MFIVTDKRWCPEEDSGVFSRLFFTFCNSLVSLGYHKILEHHDLWSLARCDEASVVVEHFGQNLKTTKRPEKAPQVSEGTIFHSLVLQLMSLNMIFNQCKQHVLLHISIPIVYYLRVFLLIWSENMQA